MATEIGNAGGYAPEDLLAPGLDGHFELVEDRLLAKPPMGLEANFVAIELLRLLGNHVRPRRLGYLSGLEAGCQIFPDEPRRVRIPDVCFIRADRLPGGKPPRGHAQIIPDLVAEVVSPNDLAEDIDRRLTDFLRAGTLLVWVVFPLTRCVQVYRRDGSGLRVDPEGSLDGEDVLPGFSCPLRELFAVIDGDPGPAA